MSSVEELLTVLDPIRLDRVLSAIEGIGGGVTRVSHDAVKALDEVGEASKKRRDEEKKRLDEAETQYGKLGRHVEQTYINMEREGTFRVHLWSKETEKALDRAQRKWKEYGDEARRQMTQGRGKLGGAGKALGATGNRGVFNAAMTQVGRISQALPMGGLLGLALFGVMQESEWAAAGSRVARMFAQVGEVAGSTYSEMTSRITKLRLATGFEMEAELAATAGGFAQFGIGAEEALIKSEFSAGRLGDTIFDVSLGFDFMTKSAAGTTSALVAQAAQITGEFGKSASAIFRFGFALRDSGANYQQVMSMMMQSLSGLRLQRQGVGELTKNYLQLREGLAKMEYGRSFRALDRTQRARISQLTGTGFQALAGGIGNLAQMPQGAAAFLAQRMGGRHAGGRRLDPMEMIGSFRQGMLPGQPEGGAGGHAIRMIGQFLREGPGKKFAGRAAQGDQFAEAGLSEMARMLTPIFGGTGSFEEGRALVAITKQMEEQIAAGVDEQEAIASGQEELKRAFDAQLSQLSPFERFMKQIMGQIAKIGAGSLTILVQTFELSRTRFPRTGECCSTSSARFLARVV